jgi:hypothetical protein
LKWKIIIALTIIVILGVIIGNIYYSLWLTLPFPVLDRRYCWHPDKQKLNEKQPKGFFLHWLKILPKPF